MTTVQKHHSQAYSKQVLSTEMEIAAFILDRLDHLHVDLHSEAMTLIQEAKEVISARVRYRFERSPCVLSVRNEAGKIGPKIIWVVPTQVKTEGAASQRRVYTKELPGRKNGRYPPRTFKDFDPQTRDHLIELEGRAAALRAKITYWRKLIKQQEELVSIGDEL